MQRFVTRATQTYPSLRHQIKLMSNLKIPDIDEDTLRKLPYWKQWLYRTMKEIIEEKKKKSD